MAIVRATSYTRSSKAIKATIRYNQHRAGKGGERKSRELFSLDGTMERIAAYELIDGAEKGTVFFRFVISPDQETEDIAKRLAASRPHQTDHACLTGALRAASPICCGDP